MISDMVYPLVLIGLTLAVAVAYGLRVVLKGQVHFDRVDEQGGSALLSKRVMEMGYWFFQPLAKLLCFFHVTANQVSWASLVFGGFAGCSLAFGHFGSGAAFASISAILDSLDGIVARTTHQASDAGEVLDASVDRYVEFFFLSGLIVYYRVVPAFLILTLLALLGSFMVSYSTAKAEALHIKPPKGNMRRPERAFYLTLGAALSPFTIPWLEVTREYSIPVGHPMVVALCLVAVMANVSAIERLWAIAKEIRKRESTKKNLIESVHESLSSTDEPSLIKSEPSLPRTL